MPSPGAQVSTDPLLRVRLEEAVGLERRKRRRQPEEISEKFEGQGATTAVDMLLKQQHHSTPVVLVTILVSELLSGLITLFD